MRINHTNTHTNHGSTLYPSKCVFRSDGQPSFSRASELLYLLTFLHGPSSPLDSTEAYLNLFVPCALVLFCFSFPFSFFTLFRLVHEYKQLRVCILQRASRLCHDMRGLHPLFCCCPLFFFFLSWSVTTYYSMTLELYIYIALYCIFSIYLYTLPPPPPQLIL